MKHWINKNYKTLIIAAFLIPIMTVAIVSISHVTTWYGISNPVTWAIYLSIGIEIAALSALAAISANMGSKVYFPFAVVTLIQFIGNIFFAYTYIDIDSKSFKDWVDLVSPLLEFINVTQGDYVGHKRFLALFAGGMLPIISLSFLHMLVKFTEEDRNKEQKIVEEEERHLVDDKIIQDAIEKYKKEQEENAIDPSEIARIKLSEEDLKKLEDALLNPPQPNEALINAAEKYKEKIGEKELSEEDILKEAEKIKAKRLMEKMKEIQKAREEVFGPDEDEEEPTALANSQYTEMMDDEDWGDLTEEDLIGDDEIPFEIEENVVPTIEEETENFNQIQQEVIPFDVAIDNEPEIEITNTTTNDFASMVPTNEVEEEEEVVEKTQFVTKEVVDEVQPQKEITITFNENDLKPFDVDVTVQPEILDKPMFEVKSDLGDESLSEKKNF